MYERKRKTKEDVDGMRNEGRKEKTAVSGEFLTWLSEAELPKTKNSEKFAKIKEGRAGLDTSLEVTVSGPSYVTTVGSPGKISSLMDSPEVIPATTTATWRMNHEGKQSLNNHRWYSVGVGIQPVPLDATT